MTKPDPNSLPTPERPDWAQPKAARPEFLQEAVSREVRRLGGAEQAAESAVAIVKFLRKPLEPHETMRGASHLSSADAEIALIAALSWVRKSLKEGEPEF